MRWRVSGNGAGIQQQHNLPDDDDQQQHDQQHQSDENTRSRLEDGDADEPDFATDSEEGDKMMTSTADVDEDDEDDNNGAQNDHPEQRIHPHDHVPPSPNGRLRSSGVQDDFPPNADSAVASTMTAFTTKAATPLRTDGDDEGGGSGDQASSSNNDAASPLDPGEEEKKQAESDSQHQQQRQHISSISSSSSNASPTRSTSSSALQQDGEKDEEDGDEEGADHSQPPPDQDDGEDASTPRWKPQTAQSTCEFTHTITNYSQKRESGCKKAEYSSTTVDDYGNRWRLIVYVNGNGRASNHHLSLFLQVADADDLPFGWKKAVSYVLTLEHPTGANLSYAKRNPDKTFKLCPKAIDWGWSQFITSDRIQQEGFVSSDSLTVRASVTVKSSSVSIDLEDAELYLKCAVEEGNASAVKLCLAQGAGVNCKFKDDLYTPLHTACSSSTTGGGSMEVLELLLERGADGNACNKWRETPLLIAANNGHRAAVEALLQHGADPSLCSEAGWSALTFAAHKGYDDIVSLLLRARAPVNCRVTEDSSTPLHKACAGSKPGHLVAVSLLLDGGADVHALNKWRETPLLTAANHGQAGAVEALLKAGADPCKCTDTGWSPLSIAAYKGHDDVVRLLLEEGAPTEEADPTLSALLQAATKGLPGTVELLLRHGADHTVTTKKGDTALSILVEQNLIDAAVEMVTEYKASVPRCSRDRKKVQRARLLINLRVKQQQREGGLSTTDDELDDDAGDETDEEDSSGEKSSQHDDSDEDSPTSSAVNSASSPESRKKKGKKKGGNGHRGNRLSAEQQAKAAEEALLLELEEEDAKAQKEQEEANKKSAKKRKKKERERQQKVQEEQKRQDQEKKEIQEKEKRQKENDEKLRKERDRQVKIQREKDLKEAAEREKIAGAKRKEKEDKDKRVQDRQVLQQRNQDKKAAAAAAAAPPLAPAAVAVATPGLAPVDKRGKQVKAKPGKKPQPPLQPLQPQHASNTVGLQSSRSNGVEGSASRSAPTPGVAAPSAAATKNRGWETKAKNQPQVTSAPSENRQTPPKPSLSDAASNSTSQSHHPLSQAAIASSDFLTPTRKNDPFGNSGHSADNDANGMMDFLGYDNSQAPPSTSASPFGSAPIGEMTGMQTPQQPKQFREVDAYTHAGSSQNMRNGAHGQRHDIGGMMELPAVALFRREKVSELLQRCALARSQPSSADSLSVVQEETIKRVLYRWMVRAAHDHQPCLDYIIPSWIDFDQLTTFFQRQFISESRKGLNPAMRGASMVSMESLKEAGSIMAIVCHSLAKEVADFRRRMEEQLPSDWSDANVGISASDVMRHGSVPMVLVDWANRAQVYLPATTFTRLRDRYVGPPNRLLTSVFIAQIRYETKRLIVANTTMDFRLPSNTKACLAMEAGVTAELWSDPFSALGDNVFFGQFADVDYLFGGRKPFGRDKPAEEFLARHGGSVSVLAPLDNMEASRYLHRILDLLESTDGERVPLSFTVFLHTECFHDQSDAPSIGDLHLLDSRLSDRGSAYLRGAISLVAGQHSYQAGEVDDVREVSRKGSLIVILQNNAGASRFDMRDASLSEIARSMSGNMQPPEDHHVDTPAQSFSNDFVGNIEAGYFDRMPPISPMPPQMASGDFGTIGGSAFSKSFGAPVNPASNNAARRTGSRRGRLFDLVDDGEEESSEVDVVSGMLNNLDLYNISQDVDIEAISLMGIGGPTGGGLQSGSSRGRFG